MKVGIVSESPTLKTGFGVTCYQIIMSLASAGHEVAIFGLGAFGETFDRTKYPARIWAVGRSKDQTFGHLTDFLQYEDPDILLFVSDVVSVHRWLVISRAIKWKKPIIAHLVMDGLPISRDLLANLSTLKAIITPTATGYRYLTAAGIKNVLVAPHGVDPAVFRPLGNRGALREEAGLTDKFVVGVFGRNAERKQQPRVLMALRRLCDEGLANDLVVYLHCQVKDDPALGGWDLLEVAKDLGVEDKVVFPDDTFLQLDGVPYVDEVGQVEYPHATCNVPLMPKRYSYIDRLNCCDLVINVPYCGGFELSIIEAQSCGVPIAVTNDCGIMAEVAGEGALLLEPTDVGIWKTGAKQYFVSAQTIANSIAGLKSNRSALEELRRRGRANAEAYRWDTLRQGVLTLVEAHRS